MSGVGHASPPSAEPGRYDWPQWRGPNRDGVSNETGWTAKWPAAGPKVLWSRDVGQGYAAVSVAAGRLYTAGFANGKDTVWSLDAGTGDEVWRHTYSSEKGHFGGPRAAPAVDARTVYFVSRRGDLFAIDVDTGRPRWSRDLKRDLGMRGNVGAGNRHGYACHPVIDGDRLILEVGAKAGSFAALDKRTGTVLWKSGSEKLGYATPVVADIGSVRTAVFFTASAVAGVDVDSGALTWRWPYKPEHQCAVATPIVSGDRVFFSCWYGRPRAVLLRIAGGEAHQVWANDNMRTHVNSCVLYEGRLYGFSGYVGENHRDKALRCIDFDTGKVEWEVADLGVGSLMIAGDRLIVLSETGELIVAPASPNGFEPAARAKVLNGTCWTMPVLSNGRIYVRNQQGRLVCLDVSE